MPEPLLVVTAEGRTLFNNHKASHLFGYPEDQIRAFSIVNCLPDWFNLTSAKTALETVAVNAHGRTFPVELNLAPVQTTVGPVLISLIRDLSGRDAERADFASEQYHLREQIEQLSLRERDLQSEMTEAATILEAHLPSKHVRVPGLQITWRFSPCYTLGGDMIKLFPVSESSVGFCILDVSGHGIPAAMLAISLARSLSTDQTRGGILATRGGKLRRPKEILSRLNSQYQVLHEGEQFVTLLYGILDLSIRKVRYVSAGHPHPWRLSAKGVRPLEGPINPPVGVMRPLEFEETEAELSAGDSLFLFTDGVTETRDRLGVMFGEERLLELLERNKGLEPASLLKRLYAELENYRLGREQTDDVTCLILGCESSQSA